MGTNTGIGIGIGIPFKNNALGGDRPYLPPELKARLIGVWDNYGKKNTDADRNIIKNKIPNAGGDLEILNAAYEGMSGYNGYPVVFGANKTWANESNGYVTSITSNTIHITNVLNAGLALLYSYVKYNGNLQNIKEIPPFKIEIKGLEGRSKFIYKYLATSDATKETNLYLENGTHELPKSFLPTEALINNAVVGFSISPIEEGVTNFLSDITIKVLPEYEGAFVTDGIDDLITSTKTVQEMLGGSNEITVVSMMANLDSRQILCNSNYNNTNGYNVRNTLEPNGVISMLGYTDKNGTTNNLNLIMGDKDSIKLTDKVNFNSDYVFYPVQYYKAYYQVAWYWTFIANKVLTTDQINQVIAYFNLDRCVEPTVLYDVKRQGLSNDTPDSDWYLKDFSKNGFDMSLFNFAKKGNSGVGKYNFSSIDVLPNRLEGTVTSNKCHFTKKLTSTNNFCDVQVISPNEPIKFKVSGLSDGRKLFVANKSGSGSNYNFDNGEHEVSLSFSEGVGQNNPFGVTGDIGDIDVTVEFIPSHAGALCLDGVNDFGQFVGDLELKDYTLIMNRAYNNLINNQVPLISSNIVEDQTPFIVEHWNTGSNAISFSYGASCTTDIPLDINKKIVYQSTYSYMGYVIPKGNAISTGNGITLGKFGNGVQYSAICLWSLMLFPYSMSEFLIERQLKKHKLGTLYPDMVEFRPIVTYDKDLISKLKYFYIPKYANWVSISPGDYLPNNAEISFTVDLRYPVDEVSSNLVFSNLENVRVVKSSGSGNSFDIRAYVTNKSPQKINITIDEYIRYEDIVQPYPVLLRFKDENGNEVSWGGKFKVGSTITRIGSIADPESNLLNGLYSISGLSLNGKGVTSSTSIVEKQMVFKTIATYLLDNNEPKCILSPSRLRIPNSSYKILGYIPDISGHGNHGVIHNSVYAKGSGVNEDGSYQFDGVDDFVTIPTIVGGKQVLMKINWQNRTGLLYDQRKNGSSIDAFAILNVNSNNSIAYNSRNTDGETYIDGILNKNIVCPQLYKITHSITIINQLANKEEVISPTIGSDTTHKVYFSQMSLYDFMLFDNISTDDKIKELNEYVGIEAKVELPPYYWDAYGKTNLDADKATIQQRGVAVGDYDLTNTNFAYDKMSGFGGYEFEKFTDTTKWIETKREDGIEVIEKNDYSFTAKKVGTGQYFWDFKNNTIKTLDRDLTVKAISNNNVYIRWEFKYRTAKKPDIDSAIILLRQAMTPNVPITVTLPYKTQEEQTELGVVEGSTYYLFYFDPSDIPVGDEYTVEMLPLYPNGLLYDAVTDYSENVNIPVFTDFTAIMKRKWLKNQGCPLIKGSKVYEGGNGNALLFEWDKAYNFVFYKRTDIMEGEVPENISFITPTNYNGNVITRGSEQDTNGICIAGDGNAGFANMVFYKLILYPKTIPLLQINFLKNLMEKDEIIDLNNPIFIKNE